MSFADYNEFIQRDLQPRMVDTVVYDKVEPFFRWFNQGTALDGDRITSKYRLGYSSNAAFYDKSDVDPASSTQTLKKPYWTKVFSHAACEVHGIDVSNEPSTSDRSMITDAVSKETEALTDINVTAFYTQIKKDVDSSSVAYSDGSLSRSTYPLLVSYEEATDATITLAYARNMIYGVTLNKQVDLKDYVCMMEGSVFYTFKPLAAALHVWNINNATARRSEDMGYQDQASFEGLTIAPPTDFTNMTTGDVLMLRRQDVIITPHRPLEIVEVESGRDSIKMVLRQGWNIHVDNPYLQGKMTDKD